MPKGGGWHGGHDSDQDDDRLLLRPASPSVQDSDQEAAGPPLSRNHDVARHIGFGPASLKRSALASPSRASSQRARGGGGLKLGAAGLTLPDPEKGDEDDPAEGDGEIKVMYFSE